MKDMVATAAALGISQIAVTDHYDPDYPLDAWGEGFSLAEYQNEMEIVKEEFKDRITLIKGLEVGIQHGGTMDKCSQVVRGYDYDFIIGSFHCAEGFELSCDPFGIDLWKMPQPPFINMSTTVFAITKTTMCWVT